MDIDGPGPVSESHRVMYRPDTGVVVATETIWTEAGADAPVHDGVLSGLCESGRVEVIEIDVLPPGAIAVDPATGAIISIDQPVPDGTVMPLPPDCI
jgi:hypothetical protein